MIASVYTASRHAPDTRTAFRRRWRAHGALAMAQADFSHPLQRYAQNDALGARYPGIARGVDGIGQLWWVNREAFAASMGSAALGEKIQPDGSRAFARAKMRMATYQEVTVRQRPGEYPARVFLLWKARSSANSWARLDWADWAERAVDGDAFPVIIGGRNIDDDSVFELVIELGFENQRQAAAGYAHWQAVAAGGVSEGALSPNPCIAVIAWRQILLDRVERCSKKSTDVPPLRRWN